MSLLYMHVRVSMCACMHISLHLSLPDAPEAANVQSNSGGFGEP